MIIGKASKQLPGAVAETKPVKQLPIFDTVRTVDRSWRTREPAVSLTVGTSQRLNVDSDDRLCEILLAPLLPTETAASGFARKEHELRDAFGSLSVTASRALHRRLAFPNPDDRVAEAFGHMMFERQRRLLAFLDDAARRHALGIR
jgi:hypothetical protein